MANFRKHKRKSHKTLPGKKPFYSTHKPEEKEVSGKDSGNKIASAIGKAAELAASSKRRKVNF